MNAHTIEELQLENQRLRHRLAEAEDALRALRAGEVDAVVVGTDGPQVYTLDAAGKPYQLLVEQMPQAAASFTMDGVILHGNSRFASLLGRPLEMLVGKPIYDFLADESRAPFASLLRDVQAAEVQAEVILRRADGTLIPAYLGINALREGPLGVCLVVTDLTEQKHYAELKLAQEALREADRRKNEFVAILAHELRNPLGPIRNAARILKLKGALAPEFRVPIEMIERQTEQLARLLDDLLDVSRITRGALEMRRDRVVISGIVEASVDACREELLQRGVDLRVSLPAEHTELVADRARLIQLLCNLITNAAKYTPSGGHIELTVTASDGILRTSVKDNGLGIPPERLTDIFELFAQVDRSSERSGGLGIGLTLVRQIATLHNGSIEARSGGIGHGSEFILTLPIAAATAAAPAMAPVRAPRLRRDAFWSWTTTVTRSRAWQCCLKSPGTRSTLHSTGMQPLPWPRNAGQTSYFSTSGCPRSAATKWPGAFASILGARRSIWWHCRAGARRTTGCIRRKRASMPISSSQLLQKLSSNFSRR